MSNINISRKVIENLILARIHLFNSLIFKISGWIPAGTLNTNIDLDIDLTPLQIKTKTVLGGNDMMLVRFIGSTDSLSIFTYFQDPPTYNIGFCTQTNPRPQFTLPDIDNNEHKVWTFEKGLNNFQLRCNGVEVFNFILAGSASEDCVKKWSIDFTQIQFVSSNQEQDTVSDFFRPLPEGKFFLQLPSHLI